MIIKYVNANGQELILNRGDYLVSAHDLRNFEWETTITNRPSGFGGRVVFSIPVQTKTLTLGIRGGKALNKNAEALLALTEPDILNNTPGKLYVGDDYLICFLAVASAVNYYSKRGGWVSKELTILVSEPFWRSEYIYRYVMGAAEAGQGSKRYTHREPYRYIASTASGIITNHHYAPSPMIITIYNEAANPAITIGKNIYQVNASIGNTQRIIIDQLRRTIESVSPNGDITNLFDYRNKANDIFAPIQPGSHNIIFDGTFDFDVTVVEQRSEPPWT
ncbi:MAG: hypothetical protein ACOX7B_03275 [Christensenellales bacterium]|jgi:hypothetical protein